MLEEFCLLVCFVKCLVSFQIFVSSAGLIRLEMYLCDMTDYTEIFGI